MKVILLEEVRGKGHEGDVVEVATGFAVNFLFPRKLAVQATSGNLKQLEARKGNIAKREETRKAEAQQLASQIEGKTVTIEARAGEGGRLFGSVTPSMIAETIAEQLGVEVDRRRMDAHGHIKTVGDHPVTVSVHTDVKADLVVRVVPEGGALEEALAPVAPATEEAPAEAEETAETPAEAEGDEDTAAEDGDEDYDDEADL